MVNITNSGQGVTATSGVDAVSITYVQATNGTNITGSALDINLTPSGDSGDVIRGITLNNVSAGSSTETGLYVGTGYDKDIELADTTPTIVLADASSVSITDGTNTLASFKEYFSAANYGVFEANGFINIDGDFFVDQFNRPAAAQTADSTTNLTSKLGDTLAWILDEAGTGGTASNATFGCSVNQGSDTNSIIVSNQINGVLGLTPETHSNTNGTNLTAPWCFVAMQNTISTFTGTFPIPNAMLAVANKFIMYYKMRPTDVTNTLSNRSMWFGANNYTSGWRGSPTWTYTAGGGVWFSNVTATGTTASANSVWGGVVRNGTSRTDVACSGASITTNYALARIEARATNDIHFYIDPDVSNGISYTDCGSATSNIPTAQMQPSIDMGQLTNYTSTTGLYTVYVDLVAFVQDDPRGTPQGQTLITAGEDTTPSAPANL